MTYEIYKINLTFLSARTIVQVVIWLSRNRLYSYKRKNKILQYRYSHKQKQSPGPESEALKPFLRKHHFMISLRTSRWLTKLFDNSREQQGPR